MNIRRTILWLMTFLLVACGQGVDINEVSSSQDNDVNETVHHENEDNNEKRVLNAQEIVVKDDDAEKKDHNYNSQPLADLYVHYIDVDQAEATLLQFSDGGESYTILYDAGDWTRRDVIDYLSHLEVREIDLIIISHPHADHIGQLADIVYQFEVGEVWMSGNTSSTQTFQTAIEAIMASDVDYYEPRAGDMFDIGPLEIEILHPLELTNALNEDSISARMTYGEISFVFTGDAYRNEELYMIERAKQIEADILQLGHHGSNTSTDPHFLQVVNPDVAIYSAGADNSYGHPHQEIVQLVLDAGIALYGTDTHGTIVIKTDGVTYDILTEKNSEHRTTEQSVQNEVGSIQNDSSNESQTHLETSTNCVGINTASIDELQLIKHIGPQRAEQLIELRPFQSVENLIKIDGIGDARLKDIVDEGKACVQ